MKLTAFKVTPTPPIIRPAGPSREWMDNTNQRFAYRCLPLTMANSHGWEILCPAAFEVYWDGGSGLDAMKVVPLEGETQRPLDFVVSHFGAGVLTFHTGYLFRTDPEHDLYVCGPVNRPKDGAAALTGIVETDWLPQPFTMNWLFTAPGGPITFEEGEPFCHIFPVRRNLVEEVEPEIRTLESDPALKERFDLWTTSRANFNRDLRVAGSTAQEDHWQKHYSRGRHPDGQTAPAEHRTKLKLREFVDRGG